MKLLGGKKLSVTTCRTFHFSEEMNSDSLTSWVTSTKESVMASCLQRKWDTKCCGEAVSIQYLANAVWGGNNGEYGNCLRSSLYGGQYCGDVDHSCLAAGHPWFPTALLCCTQIWQELLSSHKKWENGKLISKKRNNFERPLDETPQKLEKIWCCQCCWMTLQTT